MHSMGTWMHLPAGGSRSQYSALVSTSTPGAGKVYSQFQVGMMLKASSSDPGPSWAGRWVLGLPGPSSLSGKGVMRFSLPRQEGLSCCQQIQTRTPGTPWFMQWRVTTDNKTLHERGSCTSNLLLISEVIFKNLLVKREFLFQESSVPQGLQHWRGSTKANYIP